VRIQDLEAAAVVNLADRQHAIEALQARIAMLEGSRFWRWARPLRALRRGLRTIHPNEGPR
jgi:hypothetical protein